MTIRRTLLAALAAAALIAPAAQAEPADMHASTAQAAAKAQQQPKQDLRSPDARDASVTAHRSRHAVNAPGATAVGSASELPPAVRAPASRRGRSTRAPLAAPAQEPADDGSPVPGDPAGRRRARRRARRRRRALRRAPLAAPRPHRPLTTATPGRRLVRRPGPPPEMPVVRLAFTLTPPALRRRPPYRSMTS